MASDQQTAVPPVQQVQQPVPPPPFNPFQYFYFDANDVVGLHAQFYTGNLTHAQQQEVCQAIAARTARLSQHQDSSAATKKRLVRKLTVNLPT